MKENAMARKIALLALVIVLGFAGVAGLLLSARRSQAAGTVIGCPPVTLQVRTGQRFYFTVVISDVVDLYAWQSDFTYNSSYLEFKRAVYADFLGRDGAELYTQPPVAMAGSVSQLAETRLSQDQGLDGSGQVLYLEFTALKDTGTGTISVKSVNAELVDRNALEIEKSYLNSGYCRVAIDDDAPVLIQPLIGEKIFLPIVHQ
jgi:hypothetical protein